MSSLSFCAKVTKRVTCLSDKSESSELALKSRWSSQMVMSIAMQRGEVCARPHSCGTVTCDQYIRLLLFAMYDCYCLL